MLAFLLQAGCTTRHPPYSESRPKETQSASSDYQSIVERITDIVEKQLALNEGEVDVNLPLSQQKKPADELDVIEIVMNVEEAFGVGIEDEEFAAGLTVKKLADIVAKKKSLK